MFEGEKGVKCNDDSLKNGLDKPGERGVCENGLISGVCILGRDFIGVDKVEDRCRLDIRVG